MSTIRMVGVADASIKLFALFRGVVDSDRRVLHLTEHYGDCSPGAKAFIHTDDVEALHRELSTRRHAKVNPPLKRLLGRQLMLHESSE